MMKPDSDDERARQQALDRLRREIQLGLDQLARGEYFDAEEVFEELLRGLPDPDEQDS
jgi:Tfp pilus assembly protein PilF